MKRIFVLFSLLLIPLVFPFFTAQAQVPAQGEYPVMRANANVAYDQKAYTQSTVIELLASFSCLLVGVDPVDPNSPCLGVDPVSKKLGYQPGTSGGLAGIMGNMIGGMYDIPISTHDYIAYSSSKFGVTQKTYAADEGGAEGAPREAISTPGGIGFTALDPIVNVWVTFRNLVFVFFVILFVIIGFALMFRLKVGGAEATLQTVLPKIIIVVVLVVLSYAIAGFLIDMMYVLMYFIFNLFNSIDGVNLNASILQSSNPLGITGGFGGLSGITANASGAAGDVIGTIFSGTSGNVAGAVVGGIVGGIIGSLIAPGIGTVIGLGLGGLGGVFGGGGFVSVVGSVIAFVIFSIALLFALIRIWFALLKAFVSILIGAVMAPLWIAASLIPASPFPISSWFRFMIGNLLMFPAALAMFLFAFTFVELYQDRPSTGTIAFPFVGNPNDVNAFGSLLAFAIMLIIPNLIEKVKQSVGAQETSLSTAVVGSAMVGVGVAKSLVTKPLAPFFGHDSHRHPKPLQESLNNRLRRLPLGRYIISAPSSANPNSSGGGHNSP